MGNAAHTIVNLSVTFDWLSEEYGRELHARAIAGDFGEIAEYVQPPLSIGQLGAIEDAWRTEEMEFIANQLIAMEDDAPDALPGTEQQRRAYRTQDQDLEG
ncbi:hypothetical protein CKQ80_01120 [Pseudomonas moraviensis]|uniref:Uncharacterized protein n=1 Tax=Pseudomonas moraviensis TaxID=321662 RepID=A0A2A2PF94_9PSED|nr:hypothetical protein [Pseudomonas moraviensis]PAW49429.1 hypothetical protein CKQ68_18945 [Pseudomonas moraviensis]PAW53935.1 hypothetical protein CKQ80_01120 [Pseudomonas moraviensis]